MFWITEIVLNVSNNSKHALFASIHEYKNPFQSQNVWSLITFLIGETSKWLKKAVIKIYSRQARVVPEYAFQLQKWPIYFLPLKTIKHSVSVIGRFRPFQIGCLELDPKMAHFGMPEVPYLKYFFEKNYKMFLRNKTTTIELTILNQWIWTSPIPKYESHLDAHLISEASQFTL